MSGFRIWSTADGRYVGDGHLDAAFLAAGPADKAPDDFDLATFQHADGTFGLPAEPTEPADDDAELTEPEGDEPADDDAELTEPEGDEPADEEADAELTEPEKPEPAAASKRRGK